ncbi:MAG: hypothetical protein HY754_11210 [Nitrospirae bacterium]|nr:hypothetical protein [Nitrospirota bacterium]
MTHGKKRLGEMLIEAGIIDDLQLTSALGYQKQWGGKLGSVLIKMGFVDKHSLASFLERQLGIKCIILKDREIQPKVLSLVKPEIAKKYCIMPLEVDKNILSIAMSDPTDMKTIDDLTFMLGVRIKPVLSFESEIKKAITRHYEGTNEETRLFQLTTKNAPEEMELVRPEPVMRSTPRVSPEKPVEKQEATTKTVIEALISILIEKGVFTKDELIKKLSKKN